MQNPVETAAVGLCVTCVWCWQEARKTAWNAGSVPCGKGWRIIEIWLCCTVMRKKVGALSHKMPKAVERNILVYKNEEGVDLRQRCLEHVQDQSAKGILY